MLQEKMEIFIETDFVEGRQGVFTFLKNIIVYFKSLQSMAAGNWIKLTKSPKTTAIAAMAAQSFEPSIYLWLCNSNFHLADTSRLPHSINMLCMTSPISSRRIKSNFQR
jgi:hypothetical protein